MSIRTWAPILAVLLSLPALPPAATAGSRGNINLFGGGKWLDGNDWADGEHGQLGLDIMWGDERWPVMIHAYLAMSGDDDKILASDVETTTELGLGATRTWRIGSFQPYAGAGVATIAGFMEVVEPPFDIDDHGAGYGVWVCGGGFFSVGERINLGVGTRFSYAEGKIFGLDRNLGGVSLGLLLGWSWGPSVP
jgi:hypothetical protein